MHEDEPAKARNVPAGQAEQALSPAVEYIPAGQLTHDAPERICPAMQEEVFVMQSTVPASEAEPDEQAVQTSDPASEYVFEGHSMHAVEAGALENAPAGHIVHEDEPVLAW